MVLRVREAWAILLRSLLVQASWSFERMQGPGLFLMLWPGLRRRHAGDAAALARAATRRLRHFNTHPYFAGLIAAAVLHDEAAGRAPAETEELERTLMSALGAIGDSFFWAHLLPLAALVALAPALAGAWWAPLALLVLYNIPHIGVRAWGIVAARTQGRAVLATLQRRPLTRAVPALGVALAALAGLLAGLLAGSDGWRLIPVSVPASAAAAAAAFALLALVLARGLPLQRLLAGGVVATLAAGALSLVHGP